MKHLRCYISCLLLIALVLIVCPIRGVSQPAYALDINVIDLTGGSQSTALAAFEQASGYWESWLTDPITVNIEFDFATLDPGVLGGTSSNTIYSSFSSVKTALAGDITSTFDTTAVSNLPGGTSMQFRTNDSSGSVILDNNGTGNNLAIDVNRANAKAIGLLSGTDFGIDAGVEFSTLFTFDFDQSDGIDAGAFDFVGISAHEIGHALGFVSGVDIVDITSGSGPYAPINLDPYRVFSVWDLYRYSSESLTLGGAGTLDFATGPHTSGSPYFSIDGGTTSLATFESGIYNGSGRQASHWSDSFGIGIMDPTAAQGELLQITSLDVTAFDVMGYNVAPEPISSILFITGGVTLGFRRWRKSRIV